MSEIEIMETSEVVKTCITYKERLLGNLNIIYNEENSIFIFWNKYQIFFHENMNFEEATRAFVPEFQIQQLLVSNNYLIGVDYAGNVHVTSLKFKHSTQKKFKSSFQPREQGIIYCIKYTSDTALSLKFEHDSYHLCLHKMNAEFKLEKKIALKMEHERWSVKLTQGKFIVTCYKINQNDFENIKHSFNINDALKDHNLVLISFDKITVYACLFSEKSTDEEIELIKLYTSPTEICDLIINEKDSLNVLIAVTTGTLVQLPLKNIKKSPNVTLIHLNIAISKILALKSEDTLIYTDGMTMWKSENTFSKENIKFHNFFVKDIKDFIKYGELLICTTYSNLIYKFAIEDERSYLKSVNEEYCLAEKLLNEAEYYYRVIEETQKNDELMRKIQVESNYAVALSLSQRPDIMNTVINQNVTVYENYEEILKENFEISLTEELCEYFKPESLLFLIRLTTSMFQHDMSDVIINLLSDLKIHITLLSDQKVLKTTSIRFNEPLIKINILIPLCNSKNISKIHVEIKLVSIIPGVLDRSKTIWSVLHRKLLTLNTEHFIKTSTISNKIINMKTSKESLEELIYIMAEKQHRDLFDFTEVKTENMNKKIPFYVKLPDNYKQMLKEEKYFIKHFNKEKALAIQKHLANDEFLKSKSEINFEIGNEKVSLQILSGDFCKPLLKVLCNNLNIGFNIRNFFANLLHGDFNDFGPGKEYVSNALYTSTENLQKAVKKFLSNESEDFVTLAEQFQKNVVGALPM